MSGLGDEVTIAAIIERCMIAIEQKRAMEDAAREKAEAATRRWTIGQIPAWIGVLGLLVGPIIGGTIAYARIDARIEKTADMAKESKRRLDEGENEDRNVAVQLATIKADVAFIKERVK
ncbi:MAG: hypothetical protein J0H88_08350 [Sphingomonadales bacterium]|nr:hypothetical protein [Sphingomonadales bacterium]